MTRRARTQEAKNQRRQALLQAALEEFFESGFVAARMADIARRAHLSKGTLYLYFSSKEELFVELIRSIAMPNVERIERISESIESAPRAIRALLAMAAVMVRESHLPRIIKVLIGESGAFPQVVQGYREQVLDRVLAAMTRILERGHQAGELRVPDPQLTARLVVAPIVFSAIWRVVFETDDDRIDLDTLFGLHAELLIRGLSSDYSSSTEGSPS